MAALITLFILDALCIGTAIYCGWQLTKYNWKEDKYSFFSSLALASGIVGVIMFLGIFALLMKMTGIH